MLDKYGVKIGKKTTGILNEHGLPHDHKMLHKIIKKMNEKEVVQLLNELFTLYGKIEG
ncbi:MAG: hypothetical protein ACFFD4_01710 [Candidatus Odinarchaeota archaeon]